MEQPPAIQQRGDTKTGDRKMNAVVEKKPKAEVETVTMSDGTHVEFAGKRKMLKNSEFTSDGIWVGTRFDFRNGETRTYEAPGGDLKTPEGKLLVQQLAAHGAEQKIGDETAGAKSISDMVDAVDECIDRLAKGEWYIAGVGEGAGGTSVLLRALIEFTGKTKDVLAPWLKQKTPQQKKAMRLSKELKDIVARIEAEENAKTAHVDTDALFSELDAAA
jgi:hypothetical protein